MPLVTSLTHTILPTIVLEVSPNKKPEFVQYLITKWTSRWQSHIDMTENVMMDEKGKLWKAIPHCEAFALIDEWFPEAIREMKTDAEFVEALITCEKTSSKWDDIQRKFIAIYDYIHVQKTNDSVAVRMIECFKKLQPTKVYGFAVGLQMGFILNKALTMQNHQEMFEYIETLKKNKYYTDTLNGVLDELISANNIAMR
jgi:hypothetical protein